MASPQTEDGYTRIANELLDALIKADLTKRQLLVALAIVRQTYGFNRKRDRISGSQIAERTGLQRNHCSEVLAELVDRRIIQRSGKEIGIQKDYECWSEGKLNQSQNGTIKANKSQNRTVPKQDYKSPNSGLKESQNRTKTSPNSGHTKDSKDNSKDSTKDKTANLIEQRFEAWWQCYPKKRNRGQAIKAWKTIAPGDELVSQMIAAVDAAKQSQDWSKNGGKYIPFPASWLRAQGWLDDYTVDIAAATTGTAAATMENLHSLFGGEFGQEDFCDPDRVSISRL